MTSLRGWIRRRTTTNQHPQAACPVVRGVAAVPRPSIDGPTVAFATSNGRGYYSKRRYEGGQLVRASQFERRRML